MRALDDTDLHYRLVVTVDTDFDAEGRLGKDGERLPPPVVRSEAVHLARGIGDVLRALDRAIEEETKAVEKETGEVEEKMVPNRRNRLL